MNFEGGSFARCVRHPSQFFTGFCSSCLVERLSNVDSVERKPEPPSSRPQSEIVEISSFSSVVDSQRKRNEVRVRKTLLSLFQLDDRNDAIVECESKASTSGRGTAHGDKKVDSLDNKHLKDKNLGSFWSSSVLPAKRLRWRSRGAPKSGRFEDKRLERNQELSSCNWRMCHDSHESQESGKDAWEKPRHSWDGLMMSKVLTCPFAHLEEPQDGSSGIKLRLQEEHVATDTDRCNGTIDVSKGDNGNNGPSVDEQPASSNGTLRNLLRERHREEFHQEINGKDVSRNKSQRWSRVRDWGITSPFRDFSKRKEHVYGRSFSETLQKGNQDVSVPTSGILHAPRTDQSLNRTVHDGELQKLRPDWRRKGECRFGRSQSVHYPSPGNVENGLLRFYLTPMRISRRSSNNRRMQTSWFFPKGILGD